MQSLKFVVTSSDVGLVVETTSDAAATDIRKAREIIAHMVQSEKFKVKAKAVPKAGARTLSERILSLGADFFSQPREATEVGKCLSQAGFPYEAVRVCDGLLRLVKRGQLRRIGDGNKANPYKYVNP